MVKNHSPFSLSPEAEHSYQQWREWKLSVYPNDASELLVAINNPFVLTEKEKLNIKQCLISANMAIYSIKYNSDFADKKLSKC